MNKDEIHLSQFIPVRSGLITQEKINEKRKRKIVWEKLEYGRVCGCFSFDFF